MDGRTDWDIQGQMHGQIWGLRMGQTKQIGQRGQIKEICGWTDGQTDKQRFTSALKPLGLHHPPHVGVVEVEIGKIFQQMFGMNL